MTAVATEKVLVIPTELFTSLGYFQGFSSDIARYLPRLLDHKTVQYLPRGDMEQDPSFKQLIPYVLFRHTDGDGTDYLFEYERGRGQGERRLHAKHSVGVGGHISSIDAVDGLTNSAYEEGMRRELEEEVEIDAPYTEEIVGLINDDQTEVGRVHLGVVHLCDIREMRVEPREADLLEAGFRPVEDILQRLDQFESWSQIVIRSLFG